MRGPEKEKLRVGQRLEVLVAMSECAASVAANAMRSHLENAEESAVAAIVDW